MKTLTIFLAAVACLGAQPRPWSPNVPVGELRRGLLPIPQVRIPGPGGPHGVPGAPEKALISHAFATGSNGAPPMNTTGANLLYAFTVTYSTNSATPADTIGGSPSGNIWASCGSDYIPPSNGSFHLQLWLAKSAHVGANHVISASTAGFYGGIYVGAISNASTSAPCDVFNANIGSGSSLNSMSTGSITPSGNGEFILAGTMCYQGVNLSTNSYSAGLTAIDNSYQFSTLWGSVGYLVQTTAAPINPTTTNSAGSGTPIYIAMVAAIQ